MIVNRILFMVHLLMPNPMGDYKLLFDTNFYHIFQSLMIDIISIKHILFSFNGFKIHSVWWMFPFIINILRHFSYSIKFQLYISYNCSYNRNWLETLNSFDFFFLYTFIDTDVANGIHKKLKNFSLNLARIFWRLEKK